MNGIGVHRLFLGVLLLSPAIALAQDAATPALSRAEQEIAGQWGVARSALGMEAPAGVEGRPLAAATTLGGGDAEYLFVRGAEVMAVYGPQDRYSRTISLKLRTVKGAAGFDEMVCVYDITDLTMRKANPDIFSQEFPAWKPLDKTFPLDDRVRGKKEYTLRISLPDYPDADITFGRPGNETQMRTTLRRLLRLRAKQVLEEGNTIKINNKTYFSFSQSGGGISSLLYFPADLESRLDDERIEALSPVLMADLADRNGRFSGAQPLGWVDGTYFYLVYDQENGYWVATAGSPP